eukprot:CAMPEP_0198556664 /NCGR_PEP_ID=MMETSP1462-20131121/87178_1 /TAXON_ID=1333877 /ORGANISM="Brandtodinium nutriculum, Strain RCC3387" /LENGTH=52 /DNA_ID=CAMNT_0044287425 /DNA_START=8 /DNA_END=163 /DNA_ORIENTATION=-
MPLAAGHRAAAAAAAVAAETLQGVGRRRPGPSAHRAAQVAPWGFALPAQALP